MKNFQYREELLQQFERCVQAYMDAHEHVNFRSVKMVFVVTAPKKKEWKFGFVKGFDMIVSGVEESDQTEEKQAILAADSLYFEDADGESTFPKPRKTTSESSGEPDTE